MDRYKKSHTLHALAEELIPLGSQTFSKSKTLFPLGITPKFVKRGKGARFWDVDGNEFLDLVNGLGAVTLGYCYPEVDDAVRDQLANGVSFSVGNELEIDVAKKILDMVPCAEMVRYGKNGSDVNSGAIRAARAFTGRDHVALCGYHGWHDWYIGVTTRNKGVPAATSALSHAFKYNDIESLDALFKKNPGQIAAVIMEPMSYVAPKDGFLAEVLALTHKNGALLIFDEVVTGFRLSNGGAQEIFKVVPDLATFGKGMANGFPLSAITGRKDVMKLFEEIFYSSTMGGETISLAAANATLGVLQARPVLKEMARTGNALQEKIRGHIQKAGISSFAEVIGHPCFSLLTFKQAGKYSDFEFKTFFIQEIMKRGIFTHGSQNLSASWTMSDVDQAATAYGEVFQELASAREKGDLHSRLTVEPLRPLFTVRPDPGA